LPETGVAGFNGDGGAATSAMLKNPQAVAVDTAGNVYIGDTGNNRVRVVASGTIRTFAGVTGWADTIATGVAATGTQVGQSGDRGGGSRRQCVHR